MSPVALVALAACLLVRAVPARADRLAIWNIVHNSCGVSSAAGKAPSPCASYDGVAGHAVLKDRKGSFQFLVIPTVRVTGIEDPALLDPAAPDYFGAAWAARGVVSSAMGRPLMRNNISMSVNSVAARSQDQLHIHLECIRIDVRDTLAGMADAVGHDWAPLPGVLDGHRFLARRVDGEDLAGARPFSLLSRDVPSAASAMGMHTLVVVPETFSGGVHGFVILDRTSDAAAGDRGKGEELQDQECVGR